MGEGNDSGVVTGERSMTMDRFVGLEMRLDTPKGRGIFASLPIPRSTILETCPVLLLPSTDPALSHKSTLYHYTYNWPVRTITPSGEVKTSTEQAIIFGLGSMFNHSTRDQNVGWERDLQRGVVVYQALRDIEVGEELCISYGDRLWFKDTDAGQSSSDEDEEEYLANIQIDS